MNSYTIDTKLRILTPDEGKALTDGATYTTGTVYLAWNADISKWREIDESEVPPPKPLPPRTFSKLRIVSELISAGVWDAVKSYITDAGLYDLFLAAQDFREDNDYFVKGRNALQAELGWTDGQVEAVLETAAV